MTHFFLRRDSGMTLTETLIAVGVLGIVVTTAMNVLVNHARTNAKVEDIGEIYDLRTFVRNSLSCSKTFDQPSVVTACRAPSGEAIDILNHSGNILVSKSEGATTLFDYKLRGHCIENSGTNEILIDYLPLAAGGSVRQDSLSRKTADWKSLTDQIPLVCRNMGPVVPPPCTVTDESKTFILPEIAIALGLNSVDLVAPDGFHALMACDKLGFNEATAAVTGLWGVGKMGFWRKSDKGFQMVATQVKKYLSSITCRYKRSSPSCPCAKERSLISFPLNLVSSSYPDIPFYGLGANQCLRSDGTLGERAQCPEASSNKVTTEKICALMGYKTVISATQGVYGSCADNSIAQYNSTGSFSIVTACTQNSHLDSIRCGDPIPGVCNAWYESEISAPAQIAKIECGTISWVPA